MAVIYAVVLTKGLKGFGGIAIGGIVGLDIYFFGFISAASMNATRSLAPALIWFYWRFVALLLCSFHRNSFGSYDM